MSNQPPARQRTEVPFPREEWDLLVTLPGRVVVAATSAQPDTSRRTVSEGLAGIDAIAAGRASASRLVRDVVAAIYAEPDEDPPAAEEFRDRAAGIAEVLESCRAAARILAERAGREDADAYRHWLESIAARVCQASRTGGLFGVGGTVVTPAEREFLSRLGAAFDR
jgi:hypothetical protein